MNTEETQPHISKEPINLEKLPIDLLHSSQKIVEGRKAKKELDAIREKFGSNHKDFVYSLYLAVRENPDRESLFWAFENEGSSKD